MPRRTLKSAPLVAVMSFFVFVIPTWPAPVLVEKPAKEITNSIGMKLVRIEPGTFKMGSPADEIGRESYGKGTEEQHEVEITKAFYLGAYTVTQAEYEKVVERNPSWFSADGRGKDKVKGLDTSKFAVETVTWHDAVKFCEKLSAMAKEKEAGRVYRLPTEAEWEYACRAGTKTAFHYGDGLSSTQANFDGNYPYGGAEQGPYLERTCKVGSYKANAWGLHDTHGNVYQWCSDWYGKDYHINSDKKDPAGPKSGASRVRRGGCWHGDAKFCRAAQRLSDDPGNRRNNTGFRVACAAPRTR